MPLFLLLILFALSPPAQAQPGTLKIATLAPDGTRWMQIMREGAKEVKEATQGRVKIRFYPGGVMGNDKSVLRKIRVGQLQGGALTGGGLIPICPDCQLYSLPFMFHSYAEVDYVRERMDPLLSDALEKRGFVSFGISEGGFAYLMSNQPLTQVEQLRKQRVWVPEGDRVSRVVFEALSVSPIPLPLTDVLTGLQTGLIDTVSISPTAAIALQWHTQVKYLTDMPLLYLYGMLVIQKRAFQRLSKPDQATVRRVMESAFRKINQQSRQDNRNAREALQRQGIQLTRPSSRDIAQWQTIIDQAVNQMGEEGVYSSEMLGQLRQHLKKLRDSGDQ